MHHGPLNTRHNTRLPTLFDRIKAALDTPRRVSTSSMDSTPSLSPMTPSEYHHHHSSASAHAPPFPMSGQRQQHMLMQEDVKESPHPTLYGIRCSEVSQRAYSGQSSQMKSSFDRLQKLDQGKVEYRTIGKKNPLPSLPSHPTPYQIVDKKGCLHAFCLGSFSFLGKRGLFVHRPIYLCPFLPLFSLSLSLFVVFNCKARPMVQMQNLFAFLHFGLHTTQPAPLPHINSIFVQKVESGVSSGNNLCTQVQKVVRLT